jgi:tetratricopeptide (TPR) repeat protein
MGVRESSGELKFTLANRATARMLLSRFDEARRDFERALEIDSSLDEVRRNLGSLYLYTGKAEDAVRLFSDIREEKLRRGVSLQLAAAFLDLEKPAEARRVLESALKDHPTATDALLMKDLMLVACHRLRDVAAGEAVAAELEGIADHDPEAHRILAQHWLRTREKEKALELMRRSVDLAPEPRKARYRLILAEMLYRLEQYADSADEYERVPLFADESADARRYLAALYNAGRFAKALQVAQSIRGNRAAIPNFSEIEALVYERSGDLEAANRLRKHLLDSEVAPARQRINVASNLIRLGLSDEARQWVKAVALEDIADIPELLFDAARIRTLLELPGGLEYAYQLLQVDFKNPEAHMFYVSTFFRREKVDEPLLRPETVARHCTVALRHGGETQRFTLVEGEDDPANNRLGPAHPLASALMGKAVGDKVRFPEESPAEVEYEIVQIQSKYVFAFQDCLSRFNERFPTHQGLVRMEVNVEDPTRIVQMLEAQRGRAERSLTMYRGGSFPACRLARLLGRSDVELFAGLIGDRSTRILSSSGIGAELQGELSLLNETSLILVETSALVTLESLGHLDKLKQRFHTVRVTQQTLDSIVETSLNLRPEKQTGHMFSDSPGHIQMVSNTREQIEAQQQFYNRITQFLRLAAEVVAPVGGNALDEFERQDLRTTLGPCAASTISAAGASGTVMYSDDLPLRVVSRNGHGVHSVWTQTLLQDLLARSLITTEEYHKAAAWLIQSGFHFVSVDKDCLVWVLRTNGWSPTPEVARVVGVLAGPDCNDSDAVNLALDVLHEVWQEPLHPQSKQMILDLFIQVLVTGRNPGALLRALMRRNASRSVIWTQATGEIQTAIQTWFIAKRRGF